MNKVLPLLLLYLVLGSHGCSRQGESDVGHTHSYLDDEVVDLPGAPRNLGFRQFSGYLRASDTRRYHYWFVESQNDPAGDPVVLWLNGGPGCSSVNGMLTENGPLRVSDDGETLTLDQYSWNKIANMLFLESPAGVGFSYATDYNFTTNDDQVAEDNYRALKDFFQLFSHYTKHPFYVTGESYAGIYIPTLLLYLKDDPDINLQAAAIGNGYMKPPILDNSKIAFWYYHGMLSAGEWDDITSSCCDDEGEDCQFLPFRSAECQQVLASAIAKVTSLRIDPYNIYSTCKGDGTTITVRRHRIASSIAFQLRQMALQFNDPQAIREITQLSSQAESDPPCTDSRAEMTYLNHKSVRKALHIPNHVAGWTDCSPVVGRGVPPYTYHQQYNDMTSQFHTILNSGIRLVVFNGDLDTVCDFFGDQLFVDSLNLEEVQSHKPWFYQDLDGSQQIGGFTRQFQGLTYLTVKAAGHMVPTDQPVAALELFRRFLLNESF